MFPAMRKVLEILAIGLAILSAFAGAIVFAVFVIRINQEYSYDGPINTQVIGVFGDFLAGVVGTLWALTGVIIFFLALMYQVKELALQRQELKLTREDLSLAKGGDEVNQGGNEEKRGCSGCSASNDAARKGF